MLNLNQLFPFKSFILLSILFLLLSLSITYIANIFSDNFYLLWALIFFVLVSVFLILHRLIKQKNEKILHDTQELIKYLEKVSEKNYEAVFKTKYIAEFLQIEILLKNIIKRLHKKDKKK